MAIKEFDKIKVEQISYMKLEDITIEETIEILEQYKDLGAVLNGLDYFCSSLAVVISYKRLETDEEYNKRLLKTKKAAETKKINQARYKKQKEEKEIKEYERLKAKFG